MVPDEIKDHYDEIQVEGHYEEGALAVYRLLAPPMRLQRKRRGSVRADSAAGDAG